MEKTKSKEPQAKPDLSKLPDDAFVRAGVLLAAGILPFSRASLWRFAKSGKFPTPVKISSNITAWQVGAIRRWQMEKLPDDVPQAREDGQ